jgi:hypothetical protein
MGVGGRRHAPVAFTPGKGPVPIVHEAGGPQGRSGRVQKISPPPWFDPQTIQSIASCYTDWAILALYVSVSYVKLNQSGASVMESLAESSH